jgi:spore coat protein A
MSKRKSDFTRRRFLQVGGIAGAGVYLSTRAGFLQRAYGATQVAAIPLPGSAIPQFINPLPDLVLVDGTDGSGGPGALTIRMQEFLADVMPSTFVPAAGTYQGTWVWGYQTDNHPTPLAANGAKNTYINPVILAKRGVPTQITWVNELGTGAGSNLYWEDWTDQTLHWADPEGQGYINGHYSSWVPAVPHLHGGEIPPKLDGGPDAWWTANGSQGHAYYSQGGGGTGYAIYRYPNSQEAANIWFHDHGLGITRLNVYAGFQPV